MLEYLKIETPFKRDELGTKKLLEGVYRSETVAFLSNATWVCTEKIDGTNIRVCWDGHSISFYGRTDKANIPRHLYDKLCSIFLNNDTEELFEQKFGSNPVILFGEGYGCKIQNGEAYRHDVSFILFDVYLPSKGVWLERCNVEDVASAFGIDVVPVILEGTLQEAIDFVKTRPVSTIGTASMEGLVCKPKIEVFDRLGNRVIVKVKVRDFV